MKRTKALVYEHIEIKVRRVQRNLRRGVLPRDVQPVLNFYRAEGSLRRDMYDMYLQGRLVRVEGEGARQGYRLPTPMEKLAWDLNGGLWPRGTERLMLWAN
jgi:hypothetical protein